MSFFLKPLRPLKPHGSLYLCQAQADLWMLGVERLTSEGSEDEELKSQSSLDFRTWKEIEAKKH